MQNIVHELKKCPLVRVWPSTGITIVRKMAGDPLTAIGAISSIISVLKDTYRAIQRLREFQKLGGEEIDKLKATGLEIRTIQKAFENLKSNYDSGGVIEAPEPAFLDTLLVYLRKAQELEQVLGKVLPVEDETKGEKFVKGIRSLFKDKGIEKGLKSIRDILPTLQFYLSVQALQPASKDQEKRLQDWIAAPDSSPHYNTSLQLRHPHTGSWFLGGERYKEWKSQPSSILWLYGIPGCGKSVLSASIIEDLKSERKQHPKQVTDVCHFFITFSDTSLQTAVGLIRSLMAQILAQYPRTPSGPGTLYTERSADIAMDCFCNNSTIIARPS